ncbi:hypothetical protein [Clostridium folliculivorans]|uniref:Uncharacterized protein n=1 Tax=Clostridium folliculivorans TaxID=2886038 RepID=A0A9W6D9H2_9CLOT|nr:hypothetical protein [Clostridium folliculivorans]GKU23896.1 hypothetical protein CFOLD11_07220 [Clostridium folliculivorans]GKU30012.1 hypothetical protein CFB3_21190 [Clostridium folliculivorans]
MKRLSKMQKLILCYLGLAIMFVLAGNSNNTKDIFLERIFKPLRGDNWVFHYAGLILIVGIYFCLKKLNEIREKALLKTAFKRVIVTIVLISVFPAMWVYCIQFYKGFYKDLNSIYLDREKTSVNFSKNNDKLTVSGGIAIINCSNDIQKFYVKIKAPSLVKEDIKEEDITLKNEFIVHPKEEKRLLLDEELSFDKEAQYSGYSSKAFGYILFNDKDEVVFQGMSEIN